MPASRTFSEIRLVNGSTGDPLLFIDYPGKDDAFLFDAGENGRLDPSRMSDLQAVFITHHHVDHFVGLDRIVRANLDSDKTLHVYGPDNTIRKVYDRVKSYEYPFFPFMKIVMEVHDLLPGRMRTGLLECARHFPEPDIVETDWKGPLVYENDDLKVEACFADHTVPCLSYALVEKTGYHPDAVRLATGLLKSGEWVQEALALLRKGASGKTVLEIQGGRFTLASLEEQYFGSSRGARVAYVTDTAWSAVVRPGLLKLANRAQRLYCDSYYSIAQEKQAATYHHMTATHAAKFAKAAKVEELILMHFAPRYAGKYWDLVEEASAIFPKVSADLGEADRDGD
jgi:ribonuclease Z